MKQRLREIVLSNGGQIQFIAVLDQDGNELHSVGVQGLKDPIKDKSYGLTFKVARANFAKSCSGSL